MANKKSVEALQSEYLSLAGDMRNVFQGTPEGRRIMKYLEAEFYDCDLAGETDAKTNRNIGQRDVVLHLKELIKLASGARNGHT